MYVPVEALIIAGVGVIGALLWIVRAVGKSHDSIESRLREISGELASQGASIERVATTTDVEIAIERITGRLDPDQRRGRTEAKLRAIRRVYGATFASALSELNR
jgi:hypothetical protein